MVKRWFGRSSVVVLGLGGAIAVAGAAACSSDEDAAASDDVAADAGIDVYLEARPGEDSGNPDPVCPKAIDFEPSAVAARLGSEFKGPAGSGQGRCTETDLETFATTLNDSSVAIADLGKDLPADCKACVVSSVTESTWGPVVVPADAGGAFLNFGACLAAVNGSSTCGQAYQYAQFCAEEACSACAENARELCISDAQREGGPCRDAVAAIPLSCPKLNEALVRCGTNIVGHATFLCGPAADAGADGGTDGG